MTSKGKTDYSKLFTEDPEEGLATGDWLRCTVLIVSTVSIAQVINVF